MVLLAEALLGDEGLGRGFGAEGVGGLQAAKGPVGAGRGRRLELRRGREGRAGDGEVGHRGRGERGPGVANDEVQDVRAGSARCTRWRRAGQLSSWVNESGLDDSSCERAWEGLNPMDGTIRCSGNTNSAGLARLERKKASALLSECCWRGDEEGREVGDWRSEITGGGWRRVRGRFVSGA